MGCVANKSGTRVTSGPGRHLVTQPLPTAHRGSGSGIIVTSLTAVSITWEGWVQEPALHRVLGVINRLAAGGWSCPCAEELCRGRANQGWTKPESTRGTVSSGRGGRGCTVRDGWISWVTGLTGSRAVARLWKRGLETGSSARAWGCCQSKNKLQRRLSVCSSSSRVLTYRRMLKGLLSWGWRYES